MSFSLSTADATYFQEVSLDHVYLGSTLVWTSTPAEPSTFPLTFPYALS